MAVDEDDVKSILAKNRDAINFGYIEQWFPEFSKLPEHKEILEKFDDLWKQ